ncbi:hypothetical protein PAMP_002333 [Pampus punctatissimus]
MAKMNGLGLGAVVLVHKLGVMVAPKGERGKHGPRPARPGYTQCAHVFRSAETHDENSDFFVPVTCTHLCSQISSSRLRAFRDTNRGGSFEMRRHSTALDQATVVNIPGLDR